MSPEKSVDVIEVPSQTLADVEAGLSLKTRFSYMVFGKVDIRAWKIAIALKKDFPDLQIIRIENKDDAKKWLKDNDGTAIFFSNCGVPMRYLKQAESDDRTTTRKVIMEIKSQGCPK